MKGHDITIKHWGISMNLKFSWHMFQFQVNTKTARDFQSGATPFSFENIRRLEAVQPSKAVKIVQIVSLSWDKLSTKPHFHSDHHNKLSIGRGCQSLKGKNHLWGWEGILWPASTLQCIVQRYYPDRFFLSRSQFSSQKYRLKLSALETHKGRQFTNYNGVSATAILFEQRHWCAAWLSQGDKCGFYTGSSLQGKQEREHRMCISIALHTWLREEGWVRWLVHELWIYRILDDGVGATLVVDNVQWTPLAPLVDIVTRTACCSDHWSATTVCYPSHHKLGKWGVIMTQSW